MHHLVMELLGRKHPPPPEEQTDEWLKQYGCQPGVDYWIVKPAMTNNFYLVQFQTEKEECN